MAKQMVSLEAFSETVRRAVERFPAERARIERAALLVALGNVQRVTDEAYAVISQSRPEIVYAILAGTYRDRSEGCMCEDKHHRPEQQCKHEWSVDLVQVAQERQRRLDIAANLSPAELERLRRFRARYEARATA